MSSQTLPFDFANTAMPSGRLLRTYLTEAKYESVRALRAPSFAIPFLLLPIVLYVLFGILLAGSMSHGDATVARIMFVNFSVFGVMGPGMFGFGAFVATERAQGLLTLKRALPMPTASYLLAKMVMTMFFSVMIMGTLIVAALAFGHTHLSIWQFLAVAVIDILGSLPFCAIGLLIGTLASGKSAPAFVNLAYLPMMHLGGLFYPLPKSVQPIEFVSPAFYLDKLGLRVVGAPSLDQLSMGVPAVHGGIAPMIYVFILAVVTLAFAALSIRRLQGGNVRRAIASA
jgi:ABC-2 type transport system permease protein